MAMTTPPSTPVRQARTPVKLPPELIAHLSPKKPRTPVSEEQRVRDKRRENRDWKNSMSDLGIQILASKTPETNTRPKKGRSPTKTMVTLEVRAAWTDPLNGCLIPSGNQKVILYIIQTKLIV